jgi:PAS domain S-box-containing protein
MPAKQLLHQKDRKFRLLFEESPQPMWVVDAETQRFVEANAAASNLYGYDTDEFRNLTLRDIQTAEEAARLLAEMDHARHPGPTVWRHRTKDGRVIDVEISANEIRYGGRNALLAVLVDVTGRRYRTISITCSPSSPATVS